MTEGIVTAISYLCTLIGLGATAAYAVTFYLTSYNQLYLADESTYDDTDLPYTLAIVECAVSGATFFIGMLGFSLIQRPVKRAVLVTSMFFAVAFIAHGTFGVIRLWNLGLFGDDMEGTCSDAMLTGCPTTRYEALRDTEIRFREPMGGECQIFFWDTMPTRLSKTQACFNSGDINGLCTNAELENIERYMDWSKASSYGWRDDLDDITNVVINGSLATIDKVYNMKELMILQERYKANGWITETFSAQPKLAYCWYWGCSEVCLPQRFRINRWWLLSSGVLCLLHLICGIMALVLWRREPTKEMVASAAPVVDVEGQALAVPTMGRRKRRLIQNPSGLQF